MCAIVYDEAILKLSILVTSYLLQFIKNEPVLLIPDGTGTEKREEKATSFFPSLASRMCNFTSTSLKVNSVLER